MYIADALHSPKAWLLLPGIAAFCLLLLFPVIAYPQGSPQVSDVTGSFVLTTPTPTASIPTPTPTTIPAPSKVTMALLVGTWYSHDAIITISPDGRATYRESAGLCDAQKAHHVCDTIKNNHLEFGIVEQMLFTKVVGNIIHGRIISSNIGNAGKEVTLVYAENDTLQMDYANLCGPKSPPGYCGA